MDDNNVLINEHEIGTCKVYSPKRLGIKEFNMKHTPGPWKARGSQVTASCLAYSNSRPNQVCYVELDGTPDGEVKANAALIAAAPEMLEALKAVEKRVCCTEETCNDCGGIVRAAIAKAQGETP